MNKAQLIDALAERLGDRKLAAAAVATLVDVVVRTVNSGERVTITGFGVFEKRARAARTARNPRTGQTVAVQQTDVPAFRPGTLFREVVSGARALPEAGVRSSIAAPRAVAAVPSSPPANPVPVEAPAATRLAAVHVVPAKPTTTTKGSKAPKSVKAVKPVKAAKKAKAAKSEAKTKKAGKKAAGKR